MNRVFPSYLENRCLKALCDSRTRLHAENSWLEFYRAELNIYGTCGSGDSVEYLLQLMRVAWTGFTCISCRRHSVFLKAWDRGSEGRQTHKWGDQLGRVQFVAFVLN